ncbi:MAG: low temperature requirement protein A [Deltaproteobacteria bacterium]|nr:low temperature requirement protein A [Deltaproteobacteria bacterium]
MNEPQPNPLTSPEDQSATFVELFFDLVFVFSLTQVVHLLHHGLDWATIGQATLVFWLVWWAWTQFTWTLNTADTTQTVVELWTLVATAVVFFMAIALPNAFHGSGLWFAISYVVVRLIGLGLHVWVGWNDPSLLAAIRSFTVVSLLGLGAVLAGGLMGGRAQIGMWALAIALDVLAAMVGGRVDGWNLRSEHFGERHGLFVIIALGETLIVAANGFQGVGHSMEQVTVAVLAVATTCGLWWTYFPRAKPALEEQLARHPGLARAGLARDAYSLAHFLMVCGIVAFAVALEGALNPGHFSHTGAWALATGFILFVGGMGMALWRATGKCPLPRTILTLLTAAAIVLLPSGRADLALGVALAGTVLISVIEQRSLGVDRETRLESQKL